MRELIQAIWPKDNSIKTVVDLGCGDCWFTDHLTREAGVMQHVGVDIWQDYLDKAKAKNIPGFEFYCMDIREFARLKPTGKYDAALAIDVIEHFNEDEARFLISEMVRIASQLVIIWTTLGYINQDGYDNNGVPNPYQKHLCGPTADWFPSSEGWHVDVYPTWHGDRGGGLFAYKFNILKSNADNSFKL